MTVEFKKFISENKIIKPGDKILLTVSGGIDSMVMAHLFLKQNYKMGIAHCNFSLRDDESDKDEELVRKFASDHGIPFFNIRFETKSYAKEKGLSVQMAARELRYKWFEEMRENNGYDSIAVAHNLNDNIETLLINLFRGTGLTGMTGMKPVNKRIIRPLLFATRQEITAYCKKHKIIFREDRSNADTKYTRNKIRHLVIPVLKEINPSIELTLNETAGRFSGYNEIISGYISNLRKTISAEKENFITFNISQLKPYMHNKSVLYELFEPYGISNALLTDLIKVINGNTGGQVITGTHRMFKNRKELIVSEKEIPSDKEYTINKLLDFINVPCIRSAKIVRITETYLIPSDPSIGCIDYEKVTFPLTIRKWKTGDRFYPLGMNRKKKLSDYFIDNKYSKLDKENIFILESGGNIAWIIGDRIDNRFKISGSTTRVLMIKSNIKPL